MERVTETCTVGEALQRIAAHTEAAASVSLDGDTAPMLPPPIVQAIYVPGWMPRSLNPSQGHHWAVKAKYKKADRTAIADAVLFGGTRRHGNRRRRVSMTIILPPGKRCPDDDNLWKGVLDGLVHAGVLFNDSPTWVQRGKITYARGIVHPGDADPLATFIIVEDLV